MTLYTYICYSMPVIVLILRKITDKVKINNVYLSLLSSASHFKVYFISKSLTIHNNLQQYNRDITLKNSFRKLKSLGQ